MDFVDLVDMCKRRDETGGMDEVKEESWVKKGLYMGLMVFN